MIFNDSTSKGDDVKQICKSKLKRRKEKIDNLWAGLADSLHENKYGYIQEIKHNILSSMS
jgi:hypothetical protein